MRPKPASHAGKELTKGHKAQQISKVDRRDEINGSCEAMLAIIEEVLFASEFEQEARQSRMLSQTSVVAFSCFFGKWMTLGQCCSVHGKIHANPVNVFMHNAPRNNPQRLLQGNH